MADEKREPDERMILEVEGKEIDVDVYLDGEMKGIRYELTSKKSIEPMDAAFCLLLIVKNYCTQSNIDIESLLAVSELDEAADKVKH